MIKPIGILIADDHPIVRAGLRIVVESVSDIVVVDEAASGDEAAEKVHALLDDDSCNRIGLVLTDLHFGEAPGVATRVGGVDTTAAIRTLAGHGVKTPEVLVVTNYSSGSGVFGTMTVDAVGYLLKNAAPEEPIDGIRRAVRDETALNAQVTGRLMGWMRNPNAALTPCELGVLELIARDMSDREATGQLVLTEATVKSHLVHIFIRLDVSSRTVAVARAQELGMLDEQKAD